MGSIIFYYMIIINAAGFIRMSIDKQKARRRVYRVSERELLSLAVIGGSAGVLASMYMFRHKTKHKRFVFGLPVLLFLQGIVVLYIV